jgi:hypothetical protein
LFAFTRSAAQQDIAAAKSDNQKLTQELASQLPKITAIAIAATGRMGRT